MQSDFFSPGLLLLGRTRGGCLRFVPGTGSVVFSPQTNRFTAQMESGWGRGGGPRLFCSTSLMRLLCSHLTDRTEPKGEKHRRSGRASSIDPGVKVTTHLYHTDSLSGPSAPTSTSDMSPPPIFDLCWSHVRTCSCSPELVFASIRPSSCLRPGTPSVSLPCGQRQEQAEINSTAMKLMFKLNTLNPSTASRLSSSTSPSGAFHIDSSRSHWSRRHCSSLITTVCHW